MQLRDLFRGWQVSIRQTGQDWWVRLLDDEDTPIVAQSCPSIDVTGRLVVAWMRILDDEVEIDNADAARRQVTARLSDAVAQMYLGRALPPPPPDADDESLRAWFTRQMEDG
jgi:hypothetical protein